MMRTKRRLLTVKDWAGVNRMLDSLYTSCTAEQLSWYQNCTMI
jgi:hypothetical protein